MRVPVILAAVLATLCASGAQRSDGASASAKPLLILERTDGATRAEGLLARRLAVYPDGSVLSASTLPEFGRGQLEPAQISALTELVSRARLADLPAIVESRADWFDLGDASSALRWSGDDAAEVRVAGDLRADAADRALAPHGFVEVLEFIDSIPISESKEALEGDAVVEFTLEPWTRSDTSPFEAIVDVEPRAWPSGLTAPRGHTARAQGGAARDLAQCAREGRPVTWAGKSWRVRGQTLFPFEVARPRSARSEDAPQPG